MKMKAGNGRGIFVKMATSRRDGKLRSNPIRRRGTLCRVPNPMSATGMKQDRDGSRRKKALRG